MYSILRFFLFVSMAVALVGNAGATEPDRLNALIDKVSEVYGVDKLNRARTVRIEQDMRIDYGSHGYTPDINQHSPSRRHYVFDLKNKRGSAEYLTKITGNHYHGRTAPLGDGYVFIDYGNSTYEPQDSEGYISEFGGTIRTSDTLLAHALNEYRDTATDGGTVLWLGRPHDLVIFDFPASPPLTLYIQPSTSFIAKMTRTLPDGMVLSYTFSDHITRRGVTFAREQMFYPGFDTPSRVFNRNVVLNARADRKVFEIDPEIVQEPERLEQSEMTAEKVSPRAHHVGQGEAYSTFIDMGGYVIGLGAQEGLAERLEAYRAIIGFSKPLRYLLLSDHHTEEIAGALDAANLGAVLIATPGAKPATLRVLGDLDTMPEIRYVDAELRIEDVRIKNVSTAHASRVLVAYSADDKILYQSEHYASPYKSQGFYAKYSAVTLHEALKDSGFDPEWLLSASNRKPESWADFEAAVQNFNPSSCRRNRAICKGWH